MGAYLSKMRGQNPVILQSVVDAFVSIRLECFKAAGIVETVPRNNQPTSRPFPLTGKD
jgi:hypothetical protein